MEIKGLDEKLVSWRNDFLPINDITFGIKNKRDRISYWFHKKYKDFFFGVQDENSSKQAEQTHNRKKTMAAENAARVSSSEGRHERIC